MQLYLLVGGVLKESLEINSVGDVKKFHCCCGDWNDMITRSTCFWLEKSQILELLELKMLP